MTPILDALRAPSPPGRMPFLWWIEPRPFDPQEGQLCPLAGESNARGDLCARCSLGCKVGTSRRRRWPAAWYTAAQVDRLWQRQYDMSRTTGRGTRAWVAARARSLRAQFREVGRCPTILS